MFSTPAFMCLRRVPELKIQTTEGISLPMRPRQLGIPSLLNYLEVTIASWPEIFEVEKLAMREGTISFQQQGRVITALSC